MNTDNIPQLPKKAFRVTLVLNSPKPRLDQVLLEAIRKQTEQPELKAVSRIAFKELFKKRRVWIKGQAATPSSALAQGTTYVDVLGFGAD
jgi:hypothetical protein